MRTLVLKVDIDTYRGALEGVPRLLHCLQRHKLPATFLFSLGYDTHGRHLSSLMQDPLCRPFGSKLPKHLRNPYGYQTLLYGTLLPAPDIGLRCAPLLQHLTRAGYELGAHPWDSASWITHIKHNPIHYTNESLQKAIARFQLIFKEIPRVFGATHWQTQAEAIRLTQRLGFQASSDTRGMHPYLPVVEGQTILCPQLPTTLPTLSELLLRGGRDINSVSQELLDRTYHAPTCGHVYTVRAELEGGKLFYPFEQLIEGWKKQGYRFLTLGQFGEEAKAEAGGLLSLPRHTIEFNPTHSGESQQGIAA